MVQGPIINARRAFLLQVAIALEELKDMPPLLLPNSRDPQLVLVEPGDVLEIVAGWQLTARGLNWANAQRKYRNRTKCAFIGLSVDGIVRALFLVRVSKGHLHTALMYAQKDFALPASGGVALELADRVLAQIAVQFGSKYVVIDRPGEGLLAHYASRGYVVVRRSGNVVRTMIKAAPSP